MSSAEEKATIRIINDLNKMRRDIEWDISKRGLELKNLEDRQRVDRKRVKKIIETVRLIEPNTNTEDK